MIYYWIFALATCIVLTIASIIDIKTRKLNDKWLIFVLGIGLSYRLFIIQKGDWIIPTAFLLILGYVLWLFHTIGAADAKMLACLGPILPYAGLGEMFFRTILFVIIWAILAGGYGLLFRLHNKKRKRIPLLPIFFLAFILEIIVVH